MQKRHRNRSMYFHELAETSTKYFIPYITQFKQLSNECRILEIGCGDGGNLFPFAKIGCYTLGIDIAEERISDAQRFFKDYKVKGDFIATDIFLLKNYTTRFDIIICHDVIEHISNKQRLMSLLGEFLSNDGIIFISFPPWQMPFGGHQQICQNKILSHLPFVHLLPKLLYRLLLKLFGENDGCIKELLSIKETKTTIELFERVLKSIRKFNIVDRTLWLVNPHYEQKFHLNPRCQWTLLSYIPLLRNVYTTSVWYLLNHKLTSKQK